MAPFLHIPKVLAEVRTTLRGLFSHQKSQKSGREGTFHEIDEKNKSFPTSESQWTVSAVSGDGREPIPSKGIRVVERTEWRGDSRA